MKFPLTTGREFINWECELKMACIQFCIHDKKVTYPIKNTTEKVCIQNKKSKFDLHYFNVREEREFYINQTKIFNS